MSERTAYVFFMSRPCDKGESWPVVYQDRDRAENEPFRVSPVAEVRLPIAQSDTESHP